MTGENFFVISVWPSKIKKFKAEFVMAIIVVLPGMSLMIHSPLERGIDVSQFCLLHSWSRQQEKLQEKMAEYLNQWILGPDCWETARDRRIGLFASLAAKAMLDIFPTSYRVPQILPRKYFALIVAMEGEDDLAMIKNASIRNECEKILGTIVNPGKMAAFVITYDLTTNDEGMYVALSWPIDYDPLAYEPLAQTLARIGSPLHLIHVPEDDFSALVERAENDEGKIIFDANAQKLALELLAPLGIDIHWE